MRSRRLFVILNDHPLWFLSSGILLYIIVFAFLSFWKYDNFLYNALDLGIYTQVFESFRNGNFWHSSIQQSSYLGDHFEPFILVLLPFYLLIPHPKTLLVLQTIFLALPTIPIFFITRRVLRSAENAENNLSALGSSPRALRNLWSLGISFFYLLNPLVHNVNLFEFHLLPFSLIFLFSAAYFYIKSSHQSFFLFLFFSFLALLTREDISLIVFMFGVLALIERRKWYWVISPMILGAWWVLFSMKIISAFNINGGYKFLTYYSWIFQVSPFEFITQIYGATDNWLMIFGFLFVFLFLPLFGSRFLILAFPAFLQLVLANVKIGGTALTMHYAAYFLPALFLAGIFGIKKILNTRHSGPDPESITGITSIFKDRGLLIIVSNIAIIGSLIVFGPIGNFIPYLNIDQKRSVSAEETRIQKILLSDIPTQTPALLSSAYLPPRRTSRDDSALYWTFKGFKQFSAHPYVPHPSTEYALIDSEDLLGFIFSLQEYENGDNRIRDFIKERKLFVYDYADRFVLFSKNLTDTVLYKILDVLPDNAEKIENGQIVDRKNQIKLAAYKMPEASYVLMGEKEKFLIAAFSLFWEKIRETDKIYAINILLRDNKDKIALSKNYPLGYGLYPASDWERGKIIQTNQRVLMPVNLKGRYEIYIRLIDATDGGFILDQARSATTLIPEKFAGNEIFLGKVNF